MSDSAPIEANRPEIGKARQFWEQPACQHLQPRIEWTPHSFKCRRPALLRKASRSKSARPISNFPNRAANSLGFIVKMPVRGSANPFFQTGGNTDQTNENVLLVRAVEPLLVLRLNVLDSL